MSKFREFTTEIYKVNRGSKQCLKFVINSNCAGGNRVCAMNQSRTEFFKFYTLNRSEPYNFWPFQFE
jgi:hypothetical protein